MDFALSAEQALIKDAADRFVADNYASRRRAALTASADGFSREHWKTFAELGWLGIPFPEERGGFGGTPVETMILTEAFGRGLVLEPFVAVVVVAGTALAHGATSAEHARRLVRLIEGDELATLAYAEANARHDYASVETRARREGDDFVVTGAKIAVPYGAAADAYVVSARTTGEAADPHGISLLLIERDAPGVSRRDYRTVDDRRASDLTFERVRLPAPALLGELHAGLPLLERALDAGLAAAGAEAVGGMSALLELTVKHLKTRKQFGVPIGTFQALQHRAVDMLIQLELARSILYYGTMALVGDAPAPERRRALSASKVQIARSARFVGESAIQLHGGLGMSEEYEAGHYFKRLTAFGIEFGDLDFHLRRFLAQSTTLEEVAPNVRS